MIENMIKPSLFLQRLIITSDSKIVYNETFHPGLNIIRGINGTGKTTIADFIFYGLGGENINWKEEALQCDFVYCEIFVSGTIWTTRRGVKEDGKAGSDVFEGTYEASKLSPEGWRHYPSTRRADGKDSYSQLLFSQLGIPEVRENDDNLTIHKLLRALYVDQTSPMHSLLYADTWDTAIIREMIGDVLFGVYSPLLFEALVNIRKLSEEEDGKKRELKNLKSSFSEAGFLLNLAEVQAKIRIIDQSFSSVPEESTDSTRDYGLEQAIAELNKSLANALTELNNILFESEDSSLFIEALTEKLKQIDQSVATRNYLGEFKIDTCPICLSKLDLSKSDKNSCYLCHNELSGTSVNSSLIRLREEIQFQIKESNKLQEKRNSKIEELKGTVVKIKSEIASINNVLKDKVAIRASAESNVSMATILEKAELIAERKELEKNILLIGKINNIDKALSEITKSLHKYEEIKYQVETNQKYKERRVLKSIDEYTRALLKADSRYEHEFASFANVEINFPKNTFSLDGKNNFSASSVVYLKNSICFSMFFASLKNEFMCYPRFILCDNTEDKGMQPERSQAFQHKIAEISNANYDIPHQIILTTSMIADDLNIERYCIGHFFTNEKMALNFSGIDENTISEEQQENKPEHENYTEDDGDNIEI